MVFLVFLRFVLILWRDFSTDHFHIYQQEDRGPLILDPFLQGAFLTAAIPGMQEQGSALTKVPLLMHSHLQFVAHHSTS